MFQSGDRKRYLLSEKKNFFITCCVICRRLKKKINLLQYLFQQLFQFKKIQRWQEIMKLLCICILLGLLSVSNLVTSAPGKRGIYLLNIFKYVLITFWEIISYIQCFHLSFVAPRYQFKITKQFNWNQK